MMPHHADTDYDRWCNATQPYYVPYAFKGRQPDGSPAVCNWGVGGVYFRVVYTAQKKAYTSHTRPVYTV